MDKVPTTLIMVDLEYTQAENLEDNIERLANRDQLWYTYMYIVVDYTNGFFRVLKNRATGVTGIYSLSMLPMVVQNYLKWYAETVGEVRD